MTVQRKRNERQRQIWRYAWLVFRAHRRLESKDAQAEKTTGILCLKHSFKFFAKDNRSFLLHTLKVRFLSLRKDLLTVQCLSDHRPALIESTLFIFLLVIIFVVIRRMLRIIKWNILIIIIWRLDDAERCRRTNWFFRFHLCTAMFQPWESKKSSSDDTETDATYRNNRK